jgi:hypothetical protein
MMILTNLLLFGIRLWILAVKSQPLPLKYQFTERGVGQDRYVRSRMGVTGKRKLQNFLGVPTLLCMKYFLGSVTPRKVRKIHGVGGVGSDRKCCGHDGMSERKVRKLGTINAFSQVGR